MPMAWNHNVDTDLHDKSNRDIQSISLDNHLKFINKNLIILRR